MPPPCSLEFGGLPPTSGNSKNKLDITSRRKAHLVSGDDDVSIPHPSKKHKSTEDTQGEGSVLRSSLDSLGGIAAQHVTEEELEKWFQLSPEEASATITKATLQAIILQLTRAKEIREAACTAKKAKDEAKSLKSQLTKQKNDHEKKISELKKKLHLERVAHKEEIGDLESQLSTLKQENQTLLTSHESEVADLKKEISSLKKQPELNPIERQTLYEKAYNAGVDDYMKSFVRKMPEFDWASFEEVNVKWAEDVKAIIAKEDAEEEAKKKKEAQSQKETTLKQKEGDKVTQTKEGRTKK